jgi:hypothetical protein
VAQLHALRRAARAHDIAAVVVEKAVAAWLGGRGRRWPLVGWLGRNGPWWRGGSWAKSQLARGQCGRVSKEKESGLIEVCARINSGLQDWFFGIDSNQIDLNISKPKFALDSK